MRRISKHKLRGGRRLLSYLLLTTMCCGLALPGSEVVAADADSSTDSVVLSKVVSQPENAKKGEYLLTLDAYVTGTVQDVIRPADIVLVLDQSASMYKPAEAGETGTCNELLDEENVETCTFEEISTSKSCTHEGKKNATQLGYYVAQAQKPQHFFCDGEHTLKGATQRHDDNCKGTYDWYVIQYEEGTDKPWVLYTVCNSSTPSRMSTAAYETPWYDNDNVNRYTDDEMKEKIEKGELKVYQSQYGALYDAISSFAKTILESKADHRLAVVGFSNLTDGNSAYVNESEKYWDGGAGYYVGNSYYKYNYLNQSQDYTGNLTSAFMSTDSTANWSQVMSAIDAVSSDYICTHHNAGIDMANAIFAANPKESASGYDARVGRDRIVVLFTDGGPSSQLGDKEDATGMSHGGIENLSVDLAYETKNTYGATVYSICTAGLDLSKVSFLKYISSDYPNAKAKPVKTSDNYKDYLYPSGETTDSQYGATFETGEPISDELLYTYKVKNSQDLLAKFQGIANSVGNAHIELDKTTVLKDVVVNKFALPEKVTTSDIKVYTADYQGNGKFADKVLFTNAQITIDKTNNIVSVSNFDYSKNFISETGRDEETNKGEGTFYGRKLIVEIPIVVSELNKGCNYQPTNEATSAIYTGDGTLVKAFKVPHVDNPISITITKNVENTLGADQTKEFEFEITYTQVQTDKNDVIMYDDIAAGETGNTEENASNYLKATTKTVEPKKTLTLAGSGKNHSAVIKNISAGNAVTIQEKGNSGYTITEAKVGDKTYKAVNNQVEIPAVDVSEDIEIVITNTLQTTDITIAKQVTGDLGGWSENFDFQAILTDKDGKVLKLNEPEANADYTVKEDGTIVFQLQHAQKVTLENIPYGTTLTITETTGNGYTTSITHGATTTENTKKYSFEVTTTADKMITFTNEKSGTIVTGVNLGSKIVYAGVAVVALGLAVVWFVNRRRKQY